jgi:hypothetical protein
MRQRSFSKLLITTLALLGLTTCAKTRASDFFPKGSGAILNMPGEEFEELMQTTDKLLFLYVFDSQQDKSKQMNTQMISPLVEELKGFF